MPLKPLHITEMDLQRARRIAHSWESFSELSECQMENITRAILGGIIQGRQQGIVEGRQQELESAKSLQD
jgi:hypothetical protein